MLKCVYRSGGSPAGTPSTPSCTPSSTQRYWPSRGQIFIISIHQNGRKLNSVNYSAYDDVILCLYLLEERFYVSPLLDFTHVHEE
jgi:hypothetical protein